MKKRISGNTRELIKTQKGIVVAEQEKRNCKHCYFYSSRKLCTKHFLFTAGNEICSEHSTKQITVYRGGSVSSK
jgi:hypothetical protein